MSLEKTERVFSVRFTYTSHIALVNFSLRSHARKVSAFQLLTERTAGMVVDGPFGEKRSVETGVPQGSRISPYFFLYHIIKGRGAKVSGCVDDLTV